MNNLEKDLKRKVKNRKFAMENLGIGLTYTDGDLNQENGYSEEFINIYYQLVQNLKEADESHIQDGYFPINSSRKLMGKVIVFIKKAIRKMINIFLGWYIKPILDKQTFYNGKILNTVNLMHDIMKLHEQGNNQKICDLEENIEELEKKIEELEKKIEVMVDSNDSQQVLKNRMEYVLNRLNVSCDISLLEKNEMDYFEFENNFRGSRNGVKEIQSVYVPYFKEKDENRVLDIGCGRGEFLELMYENGITAYGVDNYEPFVQYCNNRGFTAVMEDALTHLNTLEDCSLGGIFMSQVVEHLSNDYVSALITVAYKKLKPGCYFILETPNPDCLAAISEFNIDMSHIKPVHYKALEYLFKAANFQSVERYHTKQCLYPVRAKHIEGNGITNIDEFNQGIDHINELLFGYRDYTLIAKK